MDKVEQPTITQALKPCPNAEAIAQEIADRTRWKKNTDTYARIYQAAYAGAIAALNTHRTTSLAAQNQQVLALVEAARDAGDVLQSAASPSNLDPQYSDQIAALGERIGYGALMHGASALWRKSLGDLAGGEFAAGPCVSTAASRLVRLDDALMPFRGETLPATPSLAAQDGLVEALEKVRKCAFVVPSIFPDRPPSVSWIVSELTKILPEMDAALTAIKGDKS